MDKSGSLRWALHVTRMEESIVMCKSTRQTHLGRPWRSWKVNIRMNPKGI